MPPLIALPTPDRRVLPWLLAAAVLALTWNLGGHRFLDPDEGRNGEIAREMAATNDYLVPHLDGLPYLDKPVVYFAAAAATMEVLGPSEAAARLPALLATLATIGMIAWFARRRWGATAGWIAGLAFATMPMVIAYARTTIFDSTLACFTTAAILAFVEDRPVLAWVAIAAGGLTKGPVAILIPLATVVPYAWLTGGSVRRLFAWRGLAAFALVALPWFLAVTARLPEFPHYAFVRETLERFTTRSFHRSAPVWYYLPILPVAALPWTVPALARLGRGRARWAWLARRVNAAAREPVLLACWVLGPLVFFTLNQSKLPQYVLPLMPALALAAARNLTREDATVPWRIYAILALALGAALAIPGWGLAALPRLTPAERAAVPVTARWLAAALAASAVLVALGRRRLSLAGGGFALTGVLLPFASASLLRAVGTDRSAFALATAARGRGRIVGVHAYPPSLPFYLREPVPVATATGRELTSNYIADFAERYRAVPDSPLLGADAWRDLLAHCDTPTVFVVRHGDREVRDALAQLPVLFADQHYLAYGPCRPDTGAVHSAVRDPRSPFRSPHSAIHHPHSAIGGLGGGG